MLISIYQWIVYIFECIVGSLQKIDEEEEERAREAAVFALDFDEKELEEIPVLTEDSEPAEKAAPEEPVLIEETPAEEPEDDDDDELVLPEPEPQERKTDTHTFTAPLLADDPRVEEDDDDDIERLSELVNELTGSYDIVSETSMDEDDDDDDEEEEDGHVIGELLSSLKEKSELFDPENPEDLELPTIAFTSVVEDWREPEKVLFYRSAGMNFDIMSQWVWRLVWNWM